MSSRLSLLVDLASLLSREVELDHLLSTVCERLAATMRADRATIWLVDAEEGDLVSRVAHLPELPGLRQPLDRGIAGFVAKTGQILRIDDVSHDARFDPSVDKLTGYKTKSMLVAPIREEGRSPVRGVVQVLNHADGAFDQEDEKYLAALAQQVARALALTTLRRRARRTGAHAARAVQPHRRAERAARGGVRAHHARGADGRVGAPAR
jgi:Nif-specific regulatory protein